MTKKASPSLSEDDLTPLLQATASRALDTCLRGARGLAVLGDPRAFGLLLQLSRDTVVRLQKTEYALVSSLQRDPLLTERVKRLMTVPGAGPITALTWALEIGDVSRFRSVTQAISYCGLCGDEKSSADKVTRMPLSKQRSAPVYPARASGSCQAGSPTEP